MNAPTSRQALNPRDFAKKYVARGWAIVPIGARSKSPGIKQWTRGGFGPEDISPEGNVGILLGTLSGNLTDIDLDAPEAVYLADEFLPLTAARFGRKGKPGSHRLYVAAGARTTRFVDPIDGSMLVELRSTKSQTVFPGSVHVTGEVIEWEEDGEPAELTFDELKAAAGILAAACVITRHVPNGAELIGRVEHQDWPEQIENLAAQVKIAEWLGRLSSPPTPRPAPSREWRGGYGEAALREECEAIRSSAPGGQSTRLNTSAFSLAQLVADGLLAFAEVEAELIDAGMAMVSDPRQGVWTRSQVERTVRSGMQAGLRNPRNRAARDFEGGANAAPNPLELFDPRSQQGQPIPPRRWMVAQWMPWHQTTSIYGDGGVGKTLLAQQLATSAALGQPWLGLEVTPCRVLCVLCEDPLDEILRRQVDINAAMLCDFDELGDVRWLVRHGEDNLLMTFDKGVGKLTPFWHQIVEQAKAFGAQLIILDTAADCFGGNENDRLEVRQFIQQACTRLALELDGAVLLCAHPSREGMRSGSGDGGSTGWSNSVRSRWYLTKPTPEKDEKVDPDLRLLSRKKANYAAVGEELELRWCQGVFQMQRGPIRDVVDQVVETGRHKEHDSKFLGAIRALKKQCRGASHSPNARNYAPKVMLNRPETKGMRASDIVATMERLFNAGRITANGEVGRGADRHPVKGIVELTDPESDKNDPADLREGSS